METMKRKQYPFNEGDDYWTIENNKVIWSSWDDVSEELHDANPNKVYFKTEEEANLFLNSNKPTFDINESVLVSGVACVITAMLGKTTADVNEEDWYEVTYSNGRTEHISAIEIRKTN